MLPEIFADLCALRLAGPAFAECLLQLLLLPAQTVKIYNGDDPHPTPYVRMLLLFAYIRTLGTSPAIVDHATTLENDWRALYGASTGLPALDAYAQDLRTVFEALMDTPLPPLQNHAMRDLLPFEDADDARIRNAVNYFRSGQNRPRMLPLRHVPSAARLAVAADDHAGTLTPAQGKAIHGRVVEFVADTAPSGLRGGGVMDHEQFIASFASRMNI